MLNNWKFWTLVVAIIGTCGGIPGIYNFFQKNKIEGKIISRYSNSTKDGTQTIFVFKLSLFAKNKHFNIKQISCEIEDMEGKKNNAIAYNSRITIFMIRKQDGLLPSGEMNFIEKSQRLLVPGDKFLNNYSFLPEEKNITGYLCFKFDGNLDRQLKSTTFIFESFGKKTRRVKIKESEIKKESLFHDDSIWEDLSEEERKVYLEK